MQKFHVVTNDAKDKELAVTKMLEQYFISHGRKCTRNISCMDKEDVPEDTDCVIVIGGDGTLIQAAGAVADKGIPLLGVNLGTLGYLAEVEKSQIIPALHCLLKDEYRIEKRMMLKGRIFSNNEFIFQGNAWNDIVITRGGSLRIIHYSIYVNNQLLNTYSADGVIISTPTGSTGYSLSAGGPIVDPRAKLIVITPICPHTLNGRSIILSPEDEIQVEVKKDEKMDRGSVEAIFDGNRKAFLTDGSKVFIGMSNQEVKMIKLSKESD